MGDSLRLTPLIGENCFHVWWMLWLIRHCASHALQIIIIIILFLQLLPVNTKAITLQSIIIMIMLHMTYVHMGLFWCNNTLWGVWARWHNVAAKHWSLLLQYITCIVCNGGLTLLSATVIWQLFKLLKCISMKLERVTDLLQKELLNSA